MKFCLKVTPRLEKNKVRALRVSNFVVCKCFLLMFLLCVLETWRRIVLFQVRLLFLALCPLRLRGRIVTPYLAQLYNILDLKGVVV